MTNLVGHYGVVRVPGVIGDGISAATGHWANHAFIVVPGNMVIEAWVPHVHRRPLSDYNGYQIAFNDHEKLTAKQRAQIVEFAESSLGWHYDYLHFALLGLYHLFGLDILAKIPKLLPASTICSRLVVLAGLAAGLDWAGNDPVHNITPAHLARRIENARMDKSAI